MATIKLGLGADNAQPEAVHAGLMAEVCKLSLSLTASNGDVFLIGKLPQGAIVTDAVLYPGPALTANSVLKAGTSASTELFFGSATYTAVTRTTVRQGWNQRISLSDDVRVLYEAIQVIQTAATMTVGHMLDLIVYYRMPGQIP